MSYTNSSNAPHVIGDACGCDRSEAMIRNQTMAETAKEISALAEQNSLLIRRIRSFLIGQPESKTERSQEPKCFRDELLKAKYETMCANEDLACLAVELGLQ